MPVFDAIEADHRLIVRLFDVIVRHAEGDDERLDLFEQVRREWLGHSRAEEEVAYASLANADSAAVARSLGEHREFDEALTQIAETPMGDSWMVQVGALRRRILTHMQVECDTLFRHAKQETSLRDQIELGGAFEDAHNRHLREVGAFS